MVKVADKTRKRHIILVDDDEVDRQIFTTALEDLKPNAKIHQLKNGIDLMTYLLDVPTEELPDLIFLDMNMPIMNGEECLRVIRSEPNRNKIPIIIYSTYYDGFKVDILKKKGADHYFLKPRTFVELKRLIAISLESISGKKSKGFTLK